MPDEVGYEVIDNAELQALAEDASLVHFVGLLNPPRPGVQQCITMLEFTHYPPDTARNELFQLRLVGWQEMLWVVVTIPQTDLGLMQSSAQQSGLRIAQGIPTLFAPDGVHTFPLAGPTVYVLENVREHPVYHNDPAEMRHMLETEQAYASILSGEKKTH